MSLRNRLGKILYDRGLAEGEVAVACSRPTLTRLLHTTGFDRIVPVTESATMTRARAPVTSLVGTGFSIIDSSM